MTDSAPQVIIIAGPNGAGKSTLAPYLLRDTLGLTEFVNADTIALGLSAYHSESVAIEAGRIMLKRLYTLAEQRAALPLKARWRVGLMPRGLGDFVSKATGFT